jgi:hypothetical protein
VSFEPLPLVLVTTPEMSPELRVADDKLVVGLGLGLDLVEVGDCRTMLRMTAAGRVSGMVGITSDVDSLLAATPDSAGQVSRLTPPLESKDGYVMTGKPTYQKHKRTIECFWDRIRDIRQSPEHAALIQSYLAETKN